jgi:hypothetical protein
VYEKRKEVEERKGEKDVNGEGEGKGKRGR